MELNKIYLGDAYKLIKSLPDNSVDLVVIDPEYQMDEHGGGGAFGNKKRPFQNEVDKLASGLKNDILFELTRVMKKTNIYIFCNKNQVRQYLNYFVNQNIDILVWHKTNPIPRNNNKYLSDLEYIIFARDEGIPLYNTYHTSSKLFQTTINKDDKNEYDHPTIKPLWIVKTLIENSSKEGDVVLDTFMGSGTTAVASKELGRNFIGFEIDPRYYQIATDRVNGISQIDRRAKENGVMDIWDFIGEES